jgi:hypothetical protein
MRRVRFSVASLLAVVFFVAVAAAALRLATDAWDSALLATTAIVLLTAALLAVHGTEPSRSYWLGFELFGLSYLVASLIPPIEARLPSTRLHALFGSAAPMTGMQGIAVADYNNDGAVDLLVSSHTALGEVYLNNGNGTFRTVMSLPLVSAGDPGTPPASLLDRLLALARPLPGAGGTIENQKRILHSILALLIAFFGGEISSAIKTQGRQALQA